MSNIVKQEFLEVPPPPPTTPTRFSMEMEKMKKKKPVLQRQEAFDMDDEEKEKEFDLCKEVKRIEIGKEEEEKAEADEGAEDFVKV
ncbi:hypothetical protein GCK72_003558 [Caenorhabditis remanei]|uniref:Uncharacterized protein n=1 Tax=Caenorhabditis remanei TaxID=31234 RepID=A0A6A5HWN7_CAERE|nr:hypothetical protein GCK72_003558 [Caenorhabditis remanei]KAF1771731.1 hypothetical protein GCK72_003558 [Caenorhabditis remanei]